MFVITLLYSNNVGCQSYFVKSCSSVAPVMNPSLCSLPVLICSDRSLFHVLHFTFKLAFVSNLFLFADHLTLPWIMFPSIASFRVWVIRLFDRARIATCFMAYGFKRLCKWIQTNSPFLPLQMNTHDACITIHWTSLCKSWSGPVSHKQRRQDLFFQWESNEHTAVAWKLSWSEPDF